MTKTIFRIRRERASAMSRDYLYVVVRHSVVDGREVEDIYAYCDTRADAEHECENANREVNSDG